VGHPFRKQTAAGGPTQRTVALGGGVTMKLVLIPAGEFVMGDAKGQRDELKGCLVEQLGSKFSQVVIDGNLAAVDRANKELVSA